MKKKQIIGMYREVFSTEKGKHVLHDILREANFLQPTNSEFESGKRALATQILLACSITEADMPDLIQDAKTYGAEDYE